MLPSDRSPQASPARSAALTCSLLLALSAASVAQGTRASYEVVFDATWSSLTHPGAYPGGAHFSPLIGATHDAGYHFWQAGGLASPGMESMAETGGKFPLSSEINAAVTAGQAGELVEGNIVFFSPGSTSVTLTATEAYPYVSLVTMIAPSPDWFVGVDGTLLLQNGRWVDELSVPLYAWDAGTDSGANFNSPNQNTQPQDPIQLITGGPFLGTTPLGTFTFRRKWSSLVYGCANPVGSLELLAGEPRVGQTLTVQLHDPTGGMNTPALTFLGISPGAAPGFPCGIPVAGAGLAGPTTAGEFLLDVLTDLRSGPLWTGAPVTTQVTVPISAGLVGTRYYLQGALFDGRVGLARGLEVQIGI